MAEKIEISISDLSRVQFISTRSGLVVTVMSPGPWKDGTKPRMIIRGTTTLTVPEISGLLSLLKKGRS